MITTGIVLNGKILSDELSIFLKSLVDETIIEIEIVEKGKKRSREQNKKYWKLLSLLEEHSDNTKNEWHDYFRIKFINKKEIIIQDEIISIPRTTTELTKNEFIEYLEKIQKFISLNFNIIL